MGTPPFLVFFLNEKDKETKLIMIPANPFIFIDSVAYTPSSVSGASNGATVNQNQVTLLRLRFVVEEYTTLRNYAMQLYKATEDLGRYRANGMNGEGFWDVIDRVKNLGPVPSPPQSLEHLIGLPELQIHPGSISNTGTVGLVDPAFGSDEVSPSVKRRRKSSELGGEHDIEDGDRREDVSNVYLVSASVCHFSSCSNRNYKLDTKWDSPFRWR